MSAVIMTRPPARWWETRLYLVANWFDGTDAGALTALAATQQVAVVDKLLHLRRKSPAGGVVPPRQRRHLQLLARQNGPLRLHRLQHRAGVRRHRHRAQPRDPAAAAHCGVALAARLRRGPGLPLGRGPLREPAGLGGGIYRPGTVPASARGLLQFGRLRPGLARGAASSTSPRAGERLRAWWAPALLAFTDTSVGRCRAVPGTPLDFDSSGPAGRPRWEPQHPAPGGGRQRAVRASQGRGRAAPVGRLQHPIRRVQAGRRRPHAAHLFTGPNVALALYGIGGSPTPKAWCYAEDPFGLVWLVRKDGILLIGTPTDEGVAWTQHAATPSTIGRYRPRLLQHLPVPEGDEDAVYALAHHGGFKALTRFESRVHHDDNDDVACLGLRGEGEDSGAGGDSRRPGHLQRLSGVGGGRNNPALGPVTVAAGVADFNDLLLATINPETGTPIPTGSRTTAPERLTSSLASPSSATSRRWTPSRPRRGTTPATSPRWASEVDNPIGPPGGPPMRDSSSRPSRATRRAPTMPPASSQEVAYAPARRPGTTAGPSSGRRCLSPSPCWASPARWTSGGRRARHPGVRHRGPRPELAPPPPPGGRGRARGLRRDARRRPAAQHRGQRCVRGGAFRR